MEMGGGLRWTKFAKSLIYLINLEMDVLQSVITHLANSERRQLLQYGVWLQAGILIPLTFCSFSVSGTSNVGFNTIFVLLLNITFVAGSHHLVDKGGSPLGAFSPQITSFPVAIITETCTTLGDL